ncbi:MAG: DUF2807 domain-containing protein, partial [Cytophagales bacterium]|nr:DUF2807 domain-containing protein [Cytophagales bacterium]
MKKAFAMIFPALLLLALVFPAGVTAAFGQTRDVSGFTGVASSGAFDVYIATGGKESVRLEGDDDLVDKIETVVEDNVLHIRTKREYQNDRLNFDGVKIHVTARELNSLRLSGSGRMRVNSPLKAEAFSAAVSGS